MFICASQVQANLLKLCIKNVSVNKNRFWKGPFLVILLVASFPLYNCFITRKDSYSVQSQKSISPDASPPEGT